MIYIYLSLDLSFKNKPKYLNSTTEANAVSVRWRIIVLQAYHCFTRV